jgi:hypothetical protein
VKKMPGMDGTGPLGFGPRTGGGFGLCPPGVSPVREYYGLGVGRGGFPWGGGRGRTWGGGRGGRWRAYPPAYYPPIQYAPYNYPSAGYNPYYAGGYYQPPQTEELNYLKDHLKEIEGEMESVRKRINELESEEKKD